MANCRQVCQKWKGIIDQIAIGKKVLKRVNIQLRAGENWIHAYNRSPKIYLVIDTSGSMNRWDGVGCNRLALAIARLRNLAINSLQLSLRSITIYTFDNSFQKWEANSIEDVDKIVNENVRSISAISNLHLVIDDIVRLHLQQNIHAQVNVISDCLLDQKDIREPIQPLKQARNLAPFRIFFHNVRASSDFLDHLKRYPPVRNRGLKRKLKFILE